jgi:hypothetical protein
MLSMSDHGDEDSEAEESESEPEIEARSEADMAVVPFLIPFPGKLDLDGNIATNWKTFKRTWDNSEIASSGVSSASMSSSPWSDIESI